MTACIYLNVNGVPALVADTVVSRSGQRAAERLLPSTVFGAEARIATTSIARKLHLLGDRIASAWSGDMVYIKECIESLSIISPALLETETSMERFKILMQDYESKNNTSALIVRLMESRANDSSKWTIRGVTPTNRISDRIFGQNVVAIGSGADELLKLCSTVSRSIAQGAATETNNPHMSFVDFLNSHTLYREAVYGDIRNYGGIYECTFFDFSAKKWVWRGSSITTLGTLFPLDDPNKATTAILESSFLYDPGPPGRVATVQIGQHGRPRIFELKLQPLEHDLFWRNRDSQIRDDLIHPPCWSGGQHG